MGSLKDFDSKIVSILSKSVTTTFDNPNRVLKFQLGLNIFVTSKSKQLKSVADLRPVSFITVLGIVCLVKYK